MAPNIRIAVAGDWGKTPWQNGPFKWIVTSENSDSNDPHTVVCDTLDEAIIVLREWCKYWTPSKPNN